MTSADRVAARRPIALTGTDTAAMAAAATDRSCPTADASPATITTSGSSTAASSCATSSTRAAATTSGQRGTYRQSSDGENDHEHSQTCHIAPPP